MGKELLFFLLMLILIFVSLIVLFTTTKFPSYKFDLSFNAGTLFDTLDMTFKDNLKQNKVE